MSENIARLRIKQTKIPATTSSIITPNPPEIFSRCFIPPIFEISKNLKSKKAKIIQIDSLGKNKHEIHIPAISSITILEGSLSSGLDKLLEDHIPTIIKTPIIMKWKKELDSKGSNKNKHKENKLAKVPGAKGINPIPRPVAIMLDLLLKKTLNYLK